MDGWMRVSDHAVRRWFERVEGFDLSPIAHHPDSVVLNILGTYGHDVELRRGFVARLTWRAAQTGASGINWRGYHFVLKNRTVVTIKPARAKQREAA